MSDAQQPIIAIGTVIDVSGHNGTVTAIAKDGLTIQLDNGRIVTMNLDNVSAAV